MSSHGDASNSPAADTSAPQTPVAHLAPVGFLRHRVGDLIKTRYEVLGRLGGGSFGSVYRVLDRAVGIELACKEMHVLNDPATPEDERKNALELFRREAQTLATLRHPHIPAAYFESEDGIWQACPVCGDTFEEAKFCPEHGAPLLSVEGRYYLMMDYVDGPTLEDLVAQAALEGRVIEEAQALEWIEGIAGALRSLHRVGIVHRDVKPENTKVRASDGAAVLLDFGLTKKSHEAGGYGTVAQTGSGRMGTRGYAPPDAREQMSPDARSDIHALGMTLLRLLTGREPNDLADLQLLRTHPPRAFNPAISPAIEHLLQHAIAPDRERRLRDADEFLDELHTALGTKGGTRQPPFTFSDGARARTPSDLARLLDTHRVEAANYLFNGMFAEWLRAGGFGAAAVAAERAVEQEREHPHRAVERLRRALASGSAQLQPRLQVEPRFVEFGPVPSGAVVEREVRLHNTGAGLLWGTLSTEADTISSHERMVMEGISVPSEWEGNDVEIKVALDTTTLQPGEARGWLRVAPNIEGGATHEVAISYTVRSLVLTIEPPILDFGTVPMGETRSIEVRVCREDTGQGGMPRGTIGAGESAGPLEFPARFEGEAAWTVTLDGARPNTAARHYESALHFSTNGGRLRLPTSYELVLPPERIGRILGIAVGAGALGSLALRGLSLLWNPQEGWRWFVASDTETAAIGAADTATTGNAATTGNVATAAIPPPLAPGGGVAPITGSAPGLVIAGAVLGLAAAFWVKRQQGTRGIGRRSTDQIFGPSLLGVGWLSGAGAGWLASAVLPVALWGIGDWLLISPARALHLAPPADQVGTGIALSALPMWALCGALGGALWGVARALEIKGAVWARFAVWGVYAALFLLALSYAVLAAA